MPSAPKKDGDRAPTMWERSPVFGCVALGVGLFTLAFGCPLDGDGHPPFWYQAGLFGTAIAGFLAGVVLSFMLSA
jgi:hypothetical protein